MPTITDASVQRSHSTPWGRLVAQRFRMPLLAGALGIGAALAGGCSKSDSGTPAATPGSCTESVLTIQFSPMYSAYIPNSVHTFQVPAITTGVAASAVKWSASDATMVNFAPDATTGGTMITVKKAGKTDIIATAGSLCGKAALTITAATEDDWAAGSARYNDGVVLRTGRGGGIGGVVQDGGAGADAATVSQAACTNCHGETANGPYKTVAHTPEQTGGFSDAELQGIFMNGTIPEGGYFDANIVSYATWQSFHKWDMTDEEAKGIITYLRSLTPAPQTGQPNLGQRPDGGNASDGGGTIMDGGFTRPEGGGGRPDGGGNGQGGRNGGNGGGNGNGNGGGNGNGNGGNSGGAAGAGVPGTGGAGTGGAEAGGAGGSTTDTGVGGAGGA